MSAEAMSVSASPVVVRCDHCNKEGPKSNCGRCKLVKYCGAECQKAAWKAQHQCMCVAKTDPLNTKAYLSSAQGKPFAPIHYAALFGKWEMMPSEIQAHYRTAATKEGATPEDFHNLTADSQEGITSAYVEGRENPLTQEEYHALTGTWYRNGPKMSSRDVLKFYENPLRSPKSSDLSGKNPTHTAVFERFNQNPPRIALIQESPVMGKGLRADESICEGEVVCSFGGELKMAPSVSMNDIRLNVLFMNEQTMSLQLAKYTNLGAFSNDGPPNCMIAHIFHRGLPPSAILRARCPINKGEFLHWNYGGEHPIKLAAYSLTGEGEAKVRSFCEEKLQTAQGYQSMRSVLVQARETYEQEMLLYLLATPQVLLEFVLKGVLDPKKLRSFLKSPEVRAHLQINRIIIDENTYQRVLSQLAKISQNEECKAVLLRQFGHLTFIPLYWLIEDLSAASFDRKFLQNYLDKAQIFDAPNRFAYDFSSAPEGGWDRLLDAYAELPAPLKNTVISQYLNMLASDEKFVGNHPDKVDQLKNLAKAFSLEDDTKAGLSPEAVAKLQSAKTTIRQKLSNAVKKEEVKE